MPGLILNKINETMAGMDVGLCRSVCVFWPLSNSKALDLPVTHPGILLLLIIRVARELFSQTRFNQKMQNGKKKSKPFSRVMW